MRIDRCRNILVLLCILLSSIDGFADSLIPISVNGGALAEPVANGNYLYIASGESIAVWDISDSTQPIRVGDTAAMPSQGPLRDMAVAGNLLYAVWNRNDGTGGIRIFSLDDPAHPVAVSEKDDYATDALTMQPSALVVSGSYLYLADDANGIFTFDVSDPLHPSVVASDPSLTLPFHHLRSVGERLIVIADRNNTSPCAYLYDATDASAPMRTASVCMDPAVISRISVTHDTVIGIGSQLQVFDTSDLNAISAIPTFATDITAADSVVMNGNTALALGAQDLQVWDFTDPLSPFLSSTEPINTFGTDEASLLPFGMVVLTHSDLGVLLNIDDPLTPTLSASLALPDVDARAGANTAAAIYMAERDYGFGVEAVESPWQLARYEPALPFDASARNYADVAGNNGRVYLAAQGSGLIVADVSDPMNPAELGRIDLPGAHAIATNGKLAFAAVSGDSAVISILSVEDPANIQVRGSLALANVYQIQLRGNTLFVAAGTDGMNIVDVSNIWEPVVVAADVGCDARAVDLSADLSKAFVACDDASMRIVDVTDPTSPALISTFVLADASANHASAILVSRNKAYLGHAFGVEEIDITDVANPASLRRYESGSSIRNFTRAGAGYVIAFSGEAGVFRFLEDPIFADGFDLGAAENLGTF